MKIQYWLALFLCSVQIGYAQIPNEKIIPIDTAFAMAGRNSTHLHLSKSVTETAHKAVDAAKNMRLPSLNVEIAAMYLGDGSIMNRDFTHAQNAPIPHFGNNFSLEASYVVFAGGAISTTIEKAELEAQVAALAHEKNSMDIRFLVAGHYLNLYKLYNQKKVFQKNIEQTNELIRQVKAKLSAGMALDNDLTRYELMQQNLELAIIEIDNNISILNKHLCITLGLPSETTILPDSSVQNIENLPLLNAGVMNDAIAQRPEIKIHSLKKDLAEKDVRLAHADKYPSFAIIGADHLNGPITFEIPPVNKNFNYWYLGVGISYKLESLYKSGKNIALAKTAYNTAELAYQAEIEHTQTAVHEAQTNYAEAFDKLQTYRKSFQLATENYNVINNRYKNDLVLITEMLDASNMKLKAELQVVNAKLDVVFNYFKLQREIGTL